MARFGVKLSLTKYGQLPRSQAGLTAEIRLCCKFTSTYTNFWYYFKRSFPVNETVDVLIYHCGYIRHGQFYHAQYDTNNTVIRFKHKRYNFGTKVVDEHGDEEQYQIHVKSPIPFDVITNFGVKSVIRFQYFTHPQQDQHVVLWQERLYLPLYKYDDYDTKITMKSAFIIGTSVYTEYRLLKTMFLPSSILHTRPLQEHEWQPPAF